MKQLLVLATFVAASSAGIAGLGGVSGIAGLGGVSGFAGLGGYSGSGNVGGYPTDGVNNGGFTSGGVGVTGLAGNGIGGFGGGGFSANSGGGGYSGADGSGFGGGGQIRKFVSVHVGPEEPQITQTKVIRAGGAPDKHVNIIFVKAPSTSSQQNTEVILPEAPQQKTLVYVLVKKQESGNNVRVRGPAPTRPSKPEVYFIRYKDGASGSAGAGALAGGGNVGPAYGPPNAGAGGQGGY